MNRALEWQSDAGRLRLLDQRLLPGRTVWLDCHDAPETAAAIRDMVVRGAPAIGITAAWGAVLSARRHFADGGDWRSRVEADLEHLAAARPTAVNLARALDRMRAALDRADAGPETVEAEAARIEAEDIAANRRIGALGAELLPQRARVLTHCNTGFLATGGHGTAAGILRSAFEAGKLHAVFATETRPWLQGLRLTTWELARDGIPVTVIVDSAAAALMRAGEVDAVVVGADRITTRGDVANKIGTYALALAARAHDIPFIVAAPSTTLDPDLAEGDRIPIEDRDPHEIWRVLGRDQAPEGVETHNPAFDITPAELVTAIVTEAGVSRPGEGV